MPKKYKDYHEEKFKLETLETMATVRQTLQLIRICAENSTSFREFRDLLDNAIAKIEAKMDE